LDRLQHVVVNGFVSSPSHVKSGVPQGSVIGPLLFLILIGDIDADLHNSSLRSFADDTRVLKGINSLRDASLLQHDLTIVYQWAMDNNMLFNSKKLELLRYGANSQLKQQTSYLAPDKSIT
jgi:ribonuclease P/MRP protein subunit RPP40